MLKARHFLRLTLAILLCLLSAGCAALRPEPPEIQLAGLSVSDLSLTHANFQATLSIYNPNRTPLEVQGLQFELFLADVRLARGVTAKEFTIPAEQSGSAGLRLATSFLDLFRLAQALKGREQVPFRLAGEVKVGGPGFLWITVPITSQGNIPLAGTFEQILADPEQFRRQPDRPTADENGKSPSSR